MGHGSSGRKTIGHHHVMLEMIDNRTCLMQFLKHLVFCSLQYSRGNFYTDTNGKAFGATSHLSKTLASSGTPALERKSAHRCRSANR